MNKVNLSKNGFKNKTYEEYEISANQFNLNFLIALIILTLIVIVLVIVNVFTSPLKMTLIMCSVSAILFIFPVIVFVVHDWILKIKPSILIWKKFKYVIFVPCFFGLMMLSIGFSFHAVLLIAAPPLMAAQYQFKRRDWVLLIISTIIAAPLIIYGNFIFGILDRNLIKNMLTDEEAMSISNRLDVLTTKRFFEIFLHYVLPRILSILAIDFLILSIVKRHNNMILKQEELADKVAKENEKNSKIHQAVIDELAAVVETRDVETGEHIRRTKKYVEILCEELSKTEKYHNILTPEIQKKIVSAAPLHDIGKIAISDLILLKPGKLSVEEFEKMKLHASKGGKMIKELFVEIDDNDFIQNAYDIAMYHHEKWDGSGYPKGLKGKEIPLSARIMAVSDVFDALVSKRVYKEPISKEEAFTILIQDAGKHFDPELIEVLKHVKDKFFEVN